MRSKIVALLFGFVFTLISYRIATPEVEAIAFCAKCGYNNCCEWNFGDGAAGCLSRYPNGSQCDFCMHWGECDAWPPGVTGDGATE